MKPEKASRFSTRGIVYGALFLAITAIIFVFAGFSGEVSSSQSGFVVDVLNAVLRFFGIFLTDIQMDSFAFFVRKFVGHILIFLLDGVFIYLALNQLLPPLKPWHYLAISIGVMLAVAGISELIQLFISGRSGNWLDVGIDCSGAVVGIAVGILLSFKQKAEMSSAS